jgi:hypothetical protein
VGFGSVWPFKSITTKRICLQTNKKHQSLTRWQWPEAIDMMDTTASWMNVVAGA